MPILKCDVVSCVHNAERCCCKGAILVEGDSAKDVEDTFCASFYEKAEDSFRNVYESPNYSLQIDCEAENCVYNEDCECQADSVGICGGKRCDCAEDTACATFKCR